MWVHPTSRALVTRLIPTPVTPNQISLLSVLAAAGAGASFVWLPRAPGALLGLGCLFLWHVLDGADGDLARRTGRASASGELIDGLCDHVSQALVYIALCLVLQRTLGVWAYPFAVAAALSHTLQANAYEAGRKTYRHWVYDASWMRQRPDRSRSWAGLANRVYLAVADAFSPGEDQVEVAMRRGCVEGAPPSAASRQLYRAMHIGLVRWSSVLGATGRSLAIIASLLGGSPLWYFLYEIIVLNMALVIILFWRSHVNHEMALLLGSLGAEL